MEEIQSNINNTKIINQMMEIWINPEIERRKKDGELDESFILWKAQIIFYPDGKKRKIRLNDEVKARVKAKLKSDITKNIGDKISFDEIENILNIKLTDEDDPDCGHITFIRNNNKCYLVFDARYNKGLSKTHISNAIQFYESAEFSLKSKNMSAFVDNLFSATELLAKSILLHIPDKQFREKASHKSIKQRFNWYANLGNIELNYCELLNKLSSFRNSARY